MYTLYTFGCITIGVYPRPTGARSPKSADISVDAVSGQYVRNFAANIVMTYTRAYLPGGARRLWNSRLFAKDSTPTSVTSVTITREIQRPYRPDIREICSAVVRLCGAFFLLFFLTIN